MEVIEGEMKKWGSSIGFLIPKNVAEKEGIREGQKFEIIIRKPSKVNMDKVFGSMKKWKKPTDKIIKDVDSELWND